MFLLARVFIVIFSLATYSFALPPYFTPNSVKDVFNDKVEVAPKEEFELLPIKKTAEVVRPSSETKLETTVDQEIVKQNQTLAEQLETKYGSPLGEFPVTAIDAAPKPFKAMIEALNAGDKELAFRYAVQYVKYQQALKEINISAAGLIGLGNVKVGSLPEKSWATSAAYSEDRYLLDLDLGSEKDVELPAQRSIDVNEEALKLIENAKKSEFVLFESERTPKIDSVSLNLNEQEERAQVTSKIKAKIPRDPKGKIEIYFFFKQTDQIARGIAPDIERLFQTYKGNADISFIGFTMERLSETSISGFRSDSGASFPILSGTELSKQLSIKSSPSMLFIAATTQKSYLVEGPKSFYYLDEIVKNIRGEK